MSETDDRRPELNPDWTNEFIMSLLRQSARVDRVREYLLTQEGPVATVVESILAGSFDGRELPGGER